MALEAETFILKLVWLMYRRGFVNKHEHTSVQKTPGIQAESKVSLLDSID